MIKLQATSYPPEPSETDVSVRAGKLQASHSGFMALVTVVIIAAAALIMSLNSSLLGLGTLEFGTIAAAGGEVAALTDACVEEALRQLRVNPAYTGDLSLLIFGESCIIEVSDLGGNERQVTATATKGDFSKRLGMKVTLGVRTVSISNWQEL